MLVLTRRLGETIRIGDDITVTVLGCHGNQVRLGIGAPRDVHIVREELLDRERSPSNWSEDQVPARRSQRGS